MLNSISISIVVCSHFVSVLSCDSTHTDTRKQQSPKSILISAFTGKDTETALLIRETLITDLAKSGNLSLLDGAQLPSNSRTSYAYKIVGNCSIVDSRVVLNIRTVNPQGQIVAGAAESATGALESASNLAHQAATRLEPRLISLISPQVATAVKSASKPVSRSASSIKTALLVSHAPVSSTPPDTESSSTTAAVINSPTISETPRTITKSAPANEPVAPSRVVPYTGVIIDTRGLGLSRSMAPSIRRANGTKLWAGVDADPDFVISEGIVVYAFTMDQALQDSRAGSRPLMLKAITRHDTPFPSDPLLSDEDSELLMKLSERDGFLAKYHVVFVVDK